MVNLTKEEIKKLELIGQGTFGKVYRSEDKVYKLYRRMVKKEAGGLTKNPSLRYKVVRLNRLMYLDRKLKHTDLIQDLVFINGKFKGIVIPYYDGITLSKLMDRPLEDKLGIAWQLVRNSKELTKAYIYPMDYKLNNAMLVNGKVKLIDLDDYHTKVDLFPNLSHQRNCIIGLDETIKTFFNDHRGVILPKDILDRLGRKPKTVNKTYEDIENYIIEKSIKYNYILISDRTDIENNIELLRNKDYRIIYIYTQENLEDVLNNLMNLGIELYDLVPIYEIKKYLNSLPQKESLKVKEDKVLTLQKTT